MKVAVDYGLSESNGICMGLVPELFDLLDTDELVVLQPVIIVERESDVLDAVRRCPRQAITLAE